MADLEVGDSIQQVQRHVGDLPGVFLSVPAREAAYTHVGITNSLHLTGGKEIITILKIIHFCSYSGVFSIDNYFFAEHLFLLFHYYKQIMDRTNRYFKKSYKSGFMVVTCAYSYLIHVMSSDDFIKSCIKII